MPTQLALRFDQVPVTCTVQERYHAIAPCLAGLRSPTELAAEQNLGYSTVTRWLRDFRSEGLPGLFPATEYPREPYTPDRVIVLLVYFKCLIPKASDRELARVIQTTLGHTLHNETIKALLQRYFFGSTRNFGMPCGIQCQPNLRRYGWRCSVCTPMVGAKSTSQYFCVAIRTLSINGCVVLSGHKRKIPRGNQCFGNRSFHAHRITQHVKFI